MKPLKKSLTSLLLLAPLFYFLQGPGAKANENNAPASSLSLHVANETYVIATKESLVTWRGSMLVGTNAHTGYVSISTGELTLKNSQLVGGSVVVDMRTITDPVYGSDNELINHLKSPDFFDVKKFPLSTFTIVRIAPGTGENVEITGDLTIKGITIAVSFPAKVEVKGRLATANGKLIIDRTKWDVRYNSGKFFDNLADEAISDNIEFDMKIVATK